MQSKRDRENREQGTTTEISSERQRDKQQHMLAPPSFLLPLNSCCCCQTSPRSLDGADKTSSQWSLLVLQPFENKFRRARYAAALSPFAQSLRCCSCIYLCCRCCCCCLAFDYEMRPRQQHCAHAPFSLSLPTSTSTSRTRECAVKSAICGALHVICICM